MKSDSKLDLSSIGAFVGRGGEAGRQVKTLEGSFSAVSKPNFATKYSFFSVF